MNQYNNETEEEKELINHYGLDKAALLMYDRHTFNYEVIKSWERGDILSLRRLAKI